MAEAKTQTQAQTPNQSHAGEVQRGENRGMQRRAEHYPSRDILGLNPFSMFRRLTEEMDRAFASSFGLSREFGESGFERGMWSPAIEVRERNNNIEICAELPGMSKDDVKVECTDEGVILEGEKRREQEHNEGGVHRSERSYGHFYRLIPLPDGADPEKAKAEFKNGVLTVQVPLSEQKRKGKQIPISS
jgi:HSP20 family protein